MMYTRSGPRNLAVNRNFLCYIDLVAQLLLSQFVHPPDHCHVAASVINHFGRPSEHWHDFLEVFWCDRGRGWHWINNEQRELLPGTLVLINADDLHGFSRMHEQPLRIVNIAFAVNTWGFLRDRYFKQPGSAEGEPWSVAPVSGREWQLAPAQLAELTRHAAELRAGARSREAIERFLLNFLHLIRSIESAKPSADLPEWLDRALRLIAKPENLHRGTAGLAELAGKSPEHVARAVRKYLSTTPTALLNEAKMLHAAERLTGSDQDILDLCGDCGFDNLSHFYALFRKRWGVAPKRYRQQQQAIVRP